MDNDFYINFQESSEASIKKGDSQGNFALKNCREVFNDADSICARLYNARMRAIDSLDDELNRFEMQFSNKHNSVYWANDFNDVFEGLKKIFKSEKTKSVRLPNINSSTIFRELGIKYFLSDQKIELREEADIQFFVVDMMFSDNGSMLMLNQTNTTLSKLSNSRTNVMFTTIDSIVGSSEWAEVIQQLTSYGKGCGMQDMIVFKGSPNCQNYLFIIDNQRTNILSKKNIRKVMTCIDCGKCKDVCPVYQTIGDEPYNNVFTGPVAHITLPFLETFESYMHLPYACTLCGACESVCPISLPIRDMIIDIRQSFLSDGVIDKKDRRKQNILQKILSNRSKMNSSKFIRGQHLSSLLSSDIKKSRVIPPLSQETFNKLYKVSENNEK